MENNMEVRYIIFSSNNVEIYFNIDNEPYRHISYSAKSKFLIDTYVKFNDDVCLNVIKYLRDNNYPISNI